MQYLMTSREALTEEISINRTLACAIQPCPGAI
jgi:hypothetical protein